MKVFPGRATCTYVYPKRCAPGPAPGCLPHETGTRSHTTPNHLRPFSGDVPSQSKDRYHRQLRCPQTGRGKCIGRNDRVSSLQYARRDTSNSQTPNARKAPNTRRTLRTKPPQWRCTLPNQRKPELMQHTSANPRPQDQISFALC